MPIDVFAQVTDINGPQRIFLSDELRNTVERFYPQQFAQLATVILGHRRLAMPSFVYQGIRRPLTIHGRGGVEKSNGEKIIALSCGMSWLPKYNRDTGDIEIIQSVDKVFYALVNPVDHDVYYGELLWWGIWPEDRVCRGAPDSPTERFDKEIWRPQQH